MSDSSTQKSPSLKFLRHDLVRSMSDGLEGRIVGFYESFGSERQWVISHPKANNKCDYKGQMEFTSIDESELEFISRNPTHVYSKKFNRITKFELGNRVKRINGDFRGMVTALRFFSNGCVYIQVDTGILKDNKIAYIFESDEMWVKDLLETKEQTTLQQRVNYIENMLTLTVQKQEFVQCVHFTFCPKTLKLECEVCPEQSLQSLLPSKGESDEHN